jgi:RNA polymerase sigma-70 factor (ECF subfamily)
MVGHNRDGEDLFQQVFFRVFKGIKQFRADSRLSTWMGSITHHVCVDYLRKRKREMGIQSYDDDQKLMHSFPSDVNWKQAEKEDINRLVLESIAKLPADFRTVITLYHLDECSYHDIAEMTGMPEGTVKSYISRGRNQLREMLTTLIPDFAEIRHDK